MSRSFSTGCYVFFWSLVLRGTDIMIGQALLLKYTPVNLDVLPLYIVLVLARAVLWGLLRRPNWTALLCGFSTSHLDLRLERAFVSSGNGISIPSPGQFLFVFGFGVALVGGPHVRTQHCSQPGR